MVLGRTCVVFKKGENEVNMADHGRTCVVFKKGENEVIMADHGRTCVTLHVGESDHGQLVKLESLRGCRLFVQYCVPV